MVDPAPEENLVLPDDKFRCKKNDGKSWRCKSNKDFLSNRPSNKKQHHSSNLPSTTSLSLSVFFSFLDKKSCSLNNEII